MQERSVSIVNLGYGKNCRRVQQEGTLVEVEHVKAHRTKKEIQQMSLLERFIAEGIEDADELATEGAMVDGGLVAQVRANTVQQEQEEVCAVLQFAASFHSLVEEWTNGRIVKSLSTSQQRSGPSRKKKGEARKHRTEWCAAANKYLVKMMRKKQQ